MAQAQPNRPQLAWIGWAHNPEVPGSNPALAYHVPRTGFRRPPGQSPVGLSAAPPSRRLKRGDASFSLVLQQEIGGLRAGQTHELPWSQPQDVARSSGLQPDLAHREGGTIKEDAGGLERERRERRRPQRDAIRSDSQLVAVDGAVGRDEDDESAAVALEARGARSEEHTSE